MAARALTRPTSTSGWLRSQTRAEHEAVELALDLGGLGHRGELATLLGGWSAVWNQVRLAASALTAATEATDELLRPSMQSLDWLHADLADLGRLQPDQAAVTAGDVGAAALRAFLGRPSASWGVAYVLRGSRLGGAVLAPLVRDALRLPSGCAVRFLSSSGTDPGREWVSFRRRLDAVDLPPPELTAAIDAARWTFRWVATVIAAGAQPTVRAGRALT